MNVIRLINQGFRWTRSRFVSGGLVLLYHRVERFDDEAGDAEICDPFATAVTPERFEQHLAFLREWAHPMELGALCRAALDGSLPTRAVAVTFDDGYQDNLTRAKPLLERHEVPATVFVSTGFMGQVFWWDELVRHVFEPQRVPDRLDLVVGGHRHAWRTGQETAARRDLLRATYRLIRPLMPEDREDVMTQLTSWSGIKRAGSGDCRALCPEEVRELAEHDLVAIGAHTVSHSPLALSPSETQKEEIFRSKRDLENVLGQPVTSFAYPYGLPRDYDAGTIELVKDAGFELACVNAPDVVWRGSDVFQLPRYWVRNWSREEFSARLRRWLK